ncbi:MAG: hypothetical protein KDD61_16750 [Bdellovibrionales bacterium]|nr:hypothetical protein [Bdellovibrionales bacterium]
MRYASLILIWFVLLGSWKAINQAGAISELVHVGIQEDLKRALTEIIVETLPNAGEIQFERLWTEPISDNQVKATFTYSYVESDEGRGKTRVKLEGYTVLTRDYNSKESIDVWSFDDLNFQNNQIIFDEGITIRADEL